MISAAAQRRGAVSAERPASPERRPIPFDYAFRFQLTGEPGNVLNSVVTVSIESTFTAVSIGYGVIPKVQPIVFGPGSSDSGRRNLLSITLGEILKALDPRLSGTSRALTNETGPEAVFKSGIKLNPDVAE